MHWRGNRLTHTYLVTENTLSFLQEGQGVSGGNQGRPTCIQELECIPLVISHGVRISHIVVYFVCYFVLTLEVFFAVYHYYSVMHYASL